MSEHSITPPPELVEKWYKEWLNCRYIGLEGYIATQAARWGADQELDACCEWINFHCSKDVSLDLQNDRRPKPPSLKQQALEALASLETSAHPSIDTTEPARCIRGILEDLPDD